MKQPLDKITWIDRDKLKPNNYNPNKVAPPELKLLKISILEDGWTQPIVVNPDYTIVDGFHRWTLVTNISDLMFRVVFRRVKGALSGIKVVLQSRYQVEVLPSRDATRSEAISTFCCDRSRGIQVCPS